MVARIRRRITFANVVALIALFVALGGGAYALGKNTVGTKQLKPKSVGAKQLKKSAVKKKKIASAAVRNSKVKKEDLKANRLRPESLTGAQIEDGGIGDAKLADLDVFGSSVVKATATDGPTEAAARTLAPRVSLASKGELTVYAKCFRDTSGPTVFAEIYVETSAAGAYVRSGEDFKIGGPATTDFLNPTTAETDRQLARATAAANDVGDDLLGFRATSPDGTAISGLGTAAAKEGVLAGGNGVYGNGNACLFLGTQLG